MLLLPLVAVALSCSKSADEARVVSIAHLKAMCHGERTIVAEECYVEGVVVANDWLGEYPKSVVVVDDSGGLEINIEAEKIYTWLPIYSRVKLFCGGRTLARIGGKVMLGAVPTGDFPIDNIPEWEARRSFKVVGVAEDFSFPTMRIAEIGLANVSRAVRIDGLRITDAELGLSWCDMVDGVTQTTMRTLVDREGNTIGVQTLASCAYGENKIPTTEFSVVGVVDAANGECFLRII
ncbi:MAG: hypothetical protein IIW38_02960, partial [Alistipes sp.]|nr:hypothetical protein [Alistipes sp.]